jgi:hypothetical protein
MFETEALTAEFAVALLVEPANHHDGDRIVFDYSRDA